MFVLPHQMAMLKADDTGDLWLRTFFDLLLLKSNQGCVEDGDVRNVTELFPTLLRQNASRMTL
jgi:hypothetical protein